MAGFVESLGKAFGYACLGMTFNPWLVGSVLLAGQEPTETYTSYSHINHRGDVMVGDVRMQPQDYAEYVQKRIAAELGYGLKSGGVEVSISQEGRMAKLEINVNGTASDRSVSEILTKIEQDLGTNFAKIGEKNQPSLAEQHPAPGSGVS